MWPEWRSGRCRSLLLACFYLATWTLAKDLKTNSKTDLNSIIAELAYGSRPVLLFSRLSDRMLLIVGGAHKGTNPIEAALEQALVFEQDQTTMVDGEYVLLKEPQLLTARWPRLYKRGPYQHMSVLLDSSGVNIVLVRQTDAKCSYLGFNLKSEKVETLNSACNSSRFSLSSAKPMHFFVMKESTFKLAMFDGSTLGQNVLKTIKVYTICELSKGTEIIVGNNTHKCKPVDWQIVGGYSDASDMVLIDESNSVVTFSMTVFTEEGKVTKVTKIAATKFWRNWQDREEPISTQAGKPYTNLIITMSSVFLISTCICISIIIYKYCAIQSKATTGNHQRAENDELNGYRPGSQIRRIFSKPGSGLPPFGDTPAKLSKQPRSAISPKANISMTPSSKQILQFVSKQSTKVVSNSAKVPLYSNATQINSRDLNLKRSSTKVASKKKRTAKVSRHKKRSKARLSRKRSRSRSRARAH